MRSLFVAALLLALAGCGGGAGSGNEPAAPTPDFSLTVAPASLRLRAGESKTVTVTAVRTGGFSGAIELALAAPPAGVGGVGSIAAAAASATFTVTAAADTVAQPYALAVTGTSGALSRTTALAATVVAVGPGVNRLTALAVTNATHPLVAVPVTPADVVQTADAGTITALVPGGTQPIVTVSFVTDGGTVTAGGVALTSPAALDRTTVHLLQVVDADGNERPYALDIGDTGLPSLFIRTDGSAPVDSRDAYVRGDVTILGGSAPHAHGLATSRMKIKGRGHSTWDQPKKPYRFTLDAAAPVLGLPAAASWVLLANHYDMSLMRNEIAFEAARSLSGPEFSPTALPVDLYLNGVYQGTYDVCEQLEVGPARIAIEAPTGDDDTGYFIEANMRSAEEGGVAGVDFFATAAGQVFDLKSPKASAVTTSQRAYIQAMVQRIEDGVATGVPADVDVASFVDWLIVEELFKNQDSYFLSSVNLYRDRGERLHLGPVWDFDLSAGNSNYGQIGGHALNDWQGWFPKHHPWYDGLFRQLAFSTAFKARWNEVRTPLRATVMAAIDRQEAMLARSQKLNFERWPVLGVGTWATPPELLAADTWPLQVDALRTWVDRRFDWMDAELNRLYPW